MSSCGVCVYTPRTEYTVQLYSCNSPCALLDKLGPDSAWDVLGPGGLAGGLRLGQVQ